MQPTDSLQIVPAVSPEQFAHIRELFHEYMAWDKQVTESMGMDFEGIFVTFYNRGKFDFPGEYASPDGCMLLALYGTQVAGCGGLRKLDVQTCEIKRVFVRPTFRGKKVGKTLMETLLQRARDMGYTRARLETADFMKDAQGLYHAVGFKDIEPYYEIADEFKPLMLFMEREL